MEKLDELPIEDPTRHHYMTIVARERLYFAIRQEDRRLFEIAMKGKILAEGTTQKEMFSRLIAGGPD